MITLLKKIRILTILCLEKEPISALSERPWKTLHPPTTYFLSFNKYSFSRYTEYQVFLMFSSEKSIKWWFFIQVTKNTKKMQKTLQKQSKIDIYNRKWMQMNVWVSITKKIGFVPTFFIFCNVDRHLAEYVVALCSSAVAKWPLPYGEIRLRSAF